MSYNEYHYTSLVVPAGWRPISLFYDSFNIASKILENEINSFCTQFSLSIRYYYLSLFIYVTCGEKAYILLLP